MTFASVGLVRCAHRHEILIAHRPHIVDCKACGYTSVVSGGHDYGFR